MGRGFLSSQLIAAETELAWIAEHSDYLGLDLGDLADQIHYDGAAAREVEGAIATAQDIAVRAQRVEGLLRAYEIHRKSVLATRKAKDDDASAR